MERLRKAFSDSFKGIPQKRVISIDETCLYDNIAPNKRWSLKGTRNYVPLQRAQSRRYSLITVTCTGILSCKLVEGSVNQHTFRDFINDLQTEGYQYLLMDNCAFHKSPTVNEVMKTKNVKPLYTSAYSPEWNQTEMYFSLLKRFLRKLYHKRLSSLSEIIEFMNKGISKLTFKGLYRHVWDAIKECQHRS